MYLRAKHKAIFHNQLRRVISISAWNIHLPFPSGASHAPSPPHYVCRLMITHWQRTCKGTHLPPEDREGLTAGLAYETGTPWAGGRVRGVSRAGGESEGAGAGPEPGLLASDGPGTHDFIQQTTAWSPHGRGPRLPGTKQLHFSTSCHHIDSTDNTGGQGTGSTCGAGCVSVTTEQLSLVARASLGQLMLSVVIN